MRTKDLFNGYEYVVRFLDSNLMLITNGQRNIQGGFSICKLMTQKLYSYLQRTNEYIRNIRQLENFTNLYKYGEIAEEKNPFV